MGKKAHQTSVYIDFEEIQAIEVREQMMHAWDGVKKLRVSDDRKIFPITSVDRANRPDFLTPDVLEIEPYYYQVWWQPHIPTPSIDKWPSEKSKGHFGIDGLALEPSSKYLSVN